MSPLAIKYNSYTQHPMQTPGERAIKYHPFNTLTLHARTPYCVCAMCGGGGDQTCLNCLGEGVTYPS